MRSRPRTAVQCHGSRGSARRRTAPAATLFVFAITLLGLPAHATETTEQEHKNNEAAQEKSHFHRNHFFGVVGWSHKDTGKNALTLGMEYSRWFARYIGVGVYIELSEGDFDADTVGLLLEGSPIKNLSLLAGPGFERTLFEEHEIVTRVGLTYKFHPRGIIVMPSAWVDFVGGHKIYFLGVGIGKGF